jgi:hypothetical protein
MTGKGWKADLYVCKRQKWRLLVGKWCIVCGAVFMLIGCIWVQGGPSGGILLMWDRRVVEKLEECVGRYVVACAFKSVKEHFEWAFSGVYGPKDYVERKLK